MKKIQFTVSSLFSRGEVWLSALFFLVTHLFHIGFLPVFADEAIYIRWAQLIQNDHLRYAFLSMADGKPPLFMWLLSVWLLPFQDPVVAGRFAALFIGLATMFVLRWIVRMFGGKGLAQFLVSLFVTVLPFWYMYHRMALMDGLLTLLLALSLGFAVKLSRAKKMSPLDAVWLALSFGGALWTKTPALFAIPIIALVPVWMSLTTKGIHVPTLLKRLIPIALGGVGGCIFFLLLRFSPSFGSLFSRSGDFTFTLHELLSGEWRYVLKDSLPRNISWMIQYATAGVMVLVVLGLFTKARSKIVLLITGALLYAAPLTLLGRVLWPRYFLPCMIFITVAAALSAADLLVQSRMRVIAGVFIALSLLYSTAFIVPLTSNLADVPFVASDRSQYISDWSAGFGNTQVRDVIVERAQQQANVANGRIIVLTEGAFGTLPDGLQIYFHHKQLPVPVEIYGIGVAVPAIPQEYRHRLPGTLVYYVANSHRIGLASRKDMQLIATYKRPDGPSLLLFEVIQQP